MSRKTVYRFFMNINLRTRITIFFFIVSLIPLFLFCFIGGRLLVSITENNIINYTEQMVGQVNRHIDVYIHDIESLTNYLSFDVHMKEFFENNGLSEEDLLEQQENIQTMLQEILFNFKDVAGIMVVNSNDRYVSTGISRISREPLTEDNWYKQAKQQSGKIHLISNIYGRNIETSYNADEVFSMVKAITDADDNCLGVILFDLKKDIITEYANETIGENGFIAVNDQENEFVYAPVNEVVYHVQPDWLVGDEVHSLVKTINGEKYQIFFQNSSYTNWKVIGVFSMGEIMGSVNHINLILVEITLVALLLSLIASVLLGRSVTNPIRHLQKLMKQVEHGDLSVRFASRYRDEIGQLGNSFDNMVVQIDSLIKVVYREQQAKREAELKILQEQIKPHFLYNTLDTIGWLARYHGADDVVALVSALTDLFRLSLNDGREIILVKDEIQHISKYMYIQKVRYEEKLNYTIAIEEDMYTYSVPKLFLQPIVENAIYHGIKGKTGKGMIQITGIQKGNTLVFEVKDDGIGIEPEKLKRMQHELDIRKNKGGYDIGYGLYNIQERIRHFCGNDCGIYIDSIYEKGTTVKVVIPIAEE